MGGGFKNGYNSKASSQLQGLRRTKMIPEEIRAENQDRWWLDESNDTPELKKIMEAARKISECMEKIESRGRR